MPTVSEQLAELINQKKALATNINTKGVTASESEKFNTLVPKVAQIEELRGEERTLDVLTKYNDTPESIVSIEYPESKNLFDVGKVEDYIFPIAKPVNLTIKNNSISGVIADAGISALLNTKHNLKSGTYTFSSTNTMSDGSDSKYRYLVRPYDNMGNIITDLQITGWEYNRYYKCYIRVSSQKQTIIIPDTVSYWQYGLVFIGTTGVTSTYSNIQLERGTTATSYEPYGIDKKIDLQLSSKNLFDISTATKSSGAATFSKTTDTITVSQNSNSIYVSAHVEIPKSLVGKTVTISAKSVTSGANTAAMRIQWTASNNTAAGDLIWGTADSSGNITATGVVPSQPDETYNILALMFYSNVEATLESGTTYTATYSDIQLEYGTTTTYTPYISDFSSVNVTACGKNLIPYPYAETTKTINGITFTVNADGSITASGTATAQSVFGLYHNESTPYKFPVKSNQIYTVSGMPTGSSSSTYFIRFTTYLDEHTNDFYTGVFSHKLNLTSDDYIKWAFIIIQSGQTVENVVFKPQLELGSAATAYEPYQAPTVYTPTSNGIVTGIQNIYPITKILTNNAGALITVKGGAYKKILPSTDKNGITKVYQEVLSADMIENLKPENIKKGITILGVTGTCASENFVLGTSTLS